MIVNIFAYRAKKVDFYDNIITSKDSVENVKIATVRGIKTTNDPKVLGQLVGRELWHVGSFDDDTGIITPCKEKLLDFDEFIPSEEMVN